MDGPVPLPAAGRRLSLVIPAYNEEAGVRQAVAEADDALAMLADDYEVLIVDDGSRDGTAAIVAEEAANRPHVRLLRHAANRGYGAALRTGFEAARFEYVAFTDADCQFYLDDLGRLLPLAETHPVAVGWREARKDSRLRCWLSRGYNVLTRTLLGTCVRDCDCALKIFRRDALAAILPETNGFFVNVEMLTRARQLGYAVTEAGVRHRPRLRGKHVVAARRAAHPGGAAAVLVVVGAIRGAGAQSGADGTAAAPAGPAPAARRGRPAVLLTATRPAAGAAGAALRRNPPADDGGGAAAHAGPQRPGLPRQAAAPLLVRHVRLRRLRRPRLGRPARPRVGRRPHCAADVPVGPPRRRGAGGAVRGAGAVPVGAVRLPRTDADDGLSALSVDDGGAGGGPCGAVGRPVPRGVVASVGGGACGSAC